ncbi:MAG: methyltransferase [Oscillospiraceae bacterium]|nr:methyltransferase [Oscillospiraceae bacterium]
MEHTEQLGEYTYRWDENCFPLGRDSLELGEFCTLKPGQTAADLGCGAGLLLLLCARREPSLTLTGVEVDPHAAELARRNLQENGLRGEIFTGDLREIGPANPADLVISNPPWYPDGSGKEGGPGRMGGCTLPELCHAAAGALKPKGRFALVYRPEGLVDLLLALREAGLEPKRLKLCAHAPDKSPYAVLVEAVKGGKPGLEVNKGATEHG